MTHEVVALTLEDIMPLRVKVLRKGTPVTHCNYPEDTYEDVIHLGVKNENTVVGTSSWFRKSAPTVLERKPCNSKAWLLTILFKVRA